MEHCLIWPDYQANIAGQGTSFVTVNSPRAGGTYGIGVEARFRIQNGFYDAPTKARLTTMLISQRGQGTLCPEITLELIELAKTAVPLPVHERADRLLRFIVNQGETVGASFDLRQEKPGLYAWSESIVDDEIGHFLDYLLKRSWLEERPGGGNRRFGDYDIPHVVRVTAAGHGHISDLLVNVDSSQAFVAMWFDSSMKEVYEKGIEPAIKDAGYDPYMVIRDDYIGKIDDKIIAEIRRSRFLVADFTHGNDGVRGSVYYEAGFAEGLNRPVIPMCKKSKVDRDPRYLHFDTRNLNHILWVDEDDLREQLRNRVIRVIGEGPKLNSG